MNVQVAVAVKTKLHEIIGMLVMAEAEEELVELAKVQLIGLANGLEIVVANDGGGEHGRTS